MPFTGAIGDTVEGYFELNAAFPAEDSTRPLRWQYNGDGIVNLSGWCVRRITNLSVTAGTFYTLGGPALTDTSACPPGIRDMLTIAERVGIGPTGLQLTVRPDGKLYIRPGWTGDLPIGSWISFDNISWRNSGP